MSISVFDIFKIGIGPSSSHTVGPMKAAKIFIEEAETAIDLKNVETIKCDLHGSLAMTGKGHGTDKAIILGLLGFDPESIDSDLIPQYLETVRKAKEITLNNTKTISFKERDDIKFRRRITLPFHPNGMAFALFDKSQKELFRKIYYSVGGGFIVAEEEVTESDILDQHHKTVPYEFNSARELLSLCEKHKLTIPELVLENEKTWRTEEEIKEKILKLWDVMQTCVKRGLKNTGELPGGLKVKRRAPKIFQDFLSRPEQSLSDALSIMDWVNLYALSVNEENAAGGQVVTAPTNGAAGIIPAILHYYERFIPHSNQQGIIDFFLTSAAIAILYKKNASISGAEVGCQGEVGVACSMAAAGLCQVMGGSIYQVENAAEIAMEHNLGLTCDPIGGLVQIPCIERNAMGAIKAINANRMALRGDGSHFVSLDKVIATMKQTGKDMKSHYKETSRGGLAVNIPEC
jgi:L-serine dehydratase